MMLGAGRGRSVKMCKDNMSRARRRHHRTRMQKRVENLLKNIWCDSDKYVMHRAVRMRDNMQTCSCYACGNPRRRAWNDNERLTMAEKRAIDNYKDNMEEVDGG